MNRSKLAVAAGILALACSSLAPSAAFAGRCNRYGATPRAPFDPSFDVRERGVPYGDFGTTPSACGFSALGLDVYGGALLAGDHDNPNLYGLIIGGVQLRFAGAISERFYLTGSLGLVEYHEVHNATIIARWNSFGPLVLGAHFVAARGDGWQFTPFVRVMAFLPSQYGFGGGFEPGVSFVVAPINPVSLHFGLSAPMSSTILDAGTWNIFVRGSAEIDWRIGAPVEVGVGVDVRGRFSPNTELDTAAPYLGIRVFPGGSSAVQLTLSALGQGADNTLARFALGYWTAW